MRRCRAVGDQCLRHHRSRPGGVRAASKRAAAARAVGRLSASFSFAAPRRRRRPRRRTRRAGNEMPGPDARLSQSPRRRAAADTGRFLYHRRRVPPRRRRLPLFRRPRRRMFVSGGENIYPADVERMLERHPDIAQAAVVPIDDDIKGQKPVAFVIKKPGRALDGEAVKRFALANAPAYHTRASSGSSMNCRSPRPTSSTARRCMRWRKSELRRNADKTNFRQRARCVPSPQRGEGQDEGFGS